MNISQNNHKLYAMSLDDDDEEDSEDVQDLLDKAASESQSGNYTQAKKTIQEAKKYEINNDDVASTFESVDKKHKAYLAALERQRQAEARAERQRQEEEEAQRQRQEARNRQHYSTGSSGGSANVSGVIVNANMTCGFTGSCLTRGLSLSGGSGYISNHGNWVSISGSVAGRYNFSASFDGNRVCSGSIYISGTKRNYDIRVHTDCSDASSREF